MSAPPRVWDILITSVPHRHEKLRGLLAELDAQLSELFGPGPVWPAGVLLYRDNLQASYGAKTGALIRASAAEYVSCIDDDDLPEPGYAAWIWAALAGDPDYVGFPVRWTRDGQPQARVEHSLRHGEWVNREDVICRDISEKNPIRRELALLGLWEGGYEAEKRWASDVRASGQCQVEAWIPEPLYWYREDTSDTFTISREPWAGPLPELPSYPWLTMMEEGC